MSVLEEPIYMTTVVVAELFDAEALTRALYGRLFSISKYTRTHTHMLTHA